MYKRLRDQVRTVYITPSMSNFVISFIVLFFPSRIHPIFLLSSWPPCGFFLSLDHMCHIWLPPSGLPVIVLYLFPLFWEKLSHWFLLVRVGQPTVAILELAVFPPEDPETLWSHV